MGWQDAPLVGEQPAAQAKTPAWAAAPVVEPAKAPTEGDLWKREIYSSAPFSLVRGVKDVIDTGAHGAAALYDMLMGTKEGDRVRAMNEAGKADFAANTEGSIVAPVARIGGNIIGTAPVVKALGAAVQAGGLTRLGTAIESGGMSLGGQGGNVAANVLTRATGGAIGGGVSAGLVNPEDAGTGAVIGAALPGVVKVAGAVGNKVGQSIRGPAVPEPVVQAARAAREAGYVIPPTQASPTLANRAVEGFAGKLTTAQNASARNQQVTNRLARDALGIDELTPEAIAALRQRMNGAYDQLGQFGNIAADDTFRAALDEAAGRTRQFAADFPELANADVENLVAAMAAREGFDSQAAIEAIKQLRYSGSANRAAMDPGKRGLGQAQMRVSAAIEDLIERSLASQGADDLLTGFRDARTTLAKAYDVEKALNPATGNVDASRFAALLKKGRPLTGELRQIGEFAGTFPTAAKLAERMGSLPQTSPLDWAAMATISGMTGNPLAMAGVAGRPAARALALSPVVQTRLTPQAAQAAQVGDDVSGWLSIPENRQALELLFARSLPVVGTARP